MKNLRALFARYMKVKDPDKAHAILSASGSERWIGCPGSIRLSEGIPSVDSPAGIRGTNTHTLLQVILENEDWEKMLRSPQADKFLAHIEHDAAMLSNALFAAEYVWKEMRLMKKRYGKKPQLFTEVKLELKGVGFGTSDIILHHPFAELHVMDYKNGTKTVEPEGNTQGLYYGVAAADRFNWEFSKPKITIIQPNSPHKKGHVRTWETTEQRLERAGRMLREGAKATKRKDAPLVKNDSWCWFCPARSKCPEHADARTDRARKLFNLT
jgi:hypothetical protein